MKRQFVFGMLALTVLGAWPQQGEAQRRSSCCKANPWSFSPYGGFMRDAYDVSPDGEDTAWQLGFRVGYALSERARITANIGYAESDDVASGPMTVDRPIYDNQYIITTGGAEYDIIPGNTSVSLGAEAGGLWREVSFDEEIGNPGPGPNDDGHSFYFTIAPALIVRHSFTPRTALEISVRDFIQPEDNVEHLPALTLGFRFR